VAPQLFVLFDETFNRQLIEQYADFLAAVESGFIR
jgi:hypothetical protein